jgi:hypothetical protein
MILFFSCKGKKQLPVIQEKRIQSVCIYDNIALRKEPRKVIKGNWLSSVSLGETVIWLGEIKVDSSDNNREYVKIELSDSTIGWASSWGIIVDAEIGAIRNSTPIYNRPDFVTITDRSFELMDIVAITDSKDDWIKVIGERRGQKGWINKKGWIKKENVTKDKKDITVAILANKELKKEDNIPYLGKIKSIIKTSPYPESYFIQKLNQHLAEGNDENVKNIEIRSDTLNTQK